MNQTQRYYQAFRTRDAEFLGLFVVGVESTGLFCLPTCAVHKADQAQCRFFPNTEAATNAGFSACLKCRPEPIALVTPACLALTQATNANPGKRQTEARANRLEAQLQTEYVSAAGFRGAFQDYLQHQRPQALRLNIAWFDSPLGPLVAIASGQALLLLEFAGRKNLAQGLTRLVSVRKAELVPELSPLLAKLGEELEDYFIGSLQQFSVPIELDGTDFQKRVWRELGKIGYGSTLSYSQQARRLGNAGAVRAVARANASNRLAILVPCHRVLAESGGLSGYAAGVSRKRYLLDLERDDLPM